MKENKSINVGFVYPLSNSDSSYLNTEMLSIIQLFENHYSGIHIRVFDWESLDNQGNILFVDGKNLGIKKSRIKADIIHFLDFDHENYKNVSLKTKWSSVNVFLNKLQKHQIPCVNPIESIRYCMAKSYLFDLADMGFPVIPSSKHKSTISLTALKKRFNNSSMVVKPFNGECSRMVKFLDHLDQQNFAAYKNESDYIVVQPYQKEIETGERSIVFMGEEVVNSVIKRFEFSKGDKSCVFATKQYIPFSPDSTAIEIGLAIGKRFPKTLHLYRMDYIQSNQGIKIMEIESVDPYHYTEYTPNYVKSLVRLYSCILKQR